MPQLAVFLDDGGVMNDNNVRRLQWQGMVGEFIAPALGGSPEMWAMANPQVMGAIQESLSWQARLQAFADADYESFERAYYLDWLGGMCAIVGVSLPPEEESIDLARRATAWIIPQVRSAFPGAVETIRLLHDEGHALHTASGESSADLALYLGGMGVRACFSRLYGPDLIGTFKVGPEFYERIMSDAGVAPADAVLVDDNPDCVRWAVQAGARGVLVGSPQAPQGSERVETISSLAELPGLIGRAATKSSC